MFVARAVAGTHPGDEISGTQARNIMTLNVKFFAWLRLAQIPRRQQRRSSGNVDRTDSTAHGETTIRETT
jgi:hypothetical protein